MAIIFWSCLILSNIHFLHESTVSAVIFGSFAVISFIVGYFKEEI